MAKEETPSLASQILFHKEGSGLGTSHRAGLLAGIQLLM